jgi:hypothetical protein
VSDLVVSDNFYVNVMGCLREGEDVWRCGDTLLIAGERLPVANIGALRAPGFRYLTVQVWDCVAEHAGVLVRVPYESFPAVDRRLVFVCMNPEADGMLHCRAPLQGASTQSRLGCSSAASLEIAVDKLWRF